LEQSSSLTPCLSLLRAFARLFLSLVERYEREWEKVCSKANGSTAEVNGCHLYKNERSISVPEKFSARNSCSNGRVLYCPLVMADVTWSNASIHTDHLHQNNILFSYEQQQPCSTVKSTDRNERGSCITTTIASSSCKVDRHAPWALARPSHRHCAKASVTMTDAERRCGGWRGTVRAPSRNSAALAWLRKNSERCSCCPAC
jgi:hypothetical protein